MRVSTGNSFANEAIRLIHSFVVVDEEFEIELYWCMSA